ncbi:hypothetical protein GCM10010401_02910 [Rarobacter faecitabidus]|uniref:Uncharacterized protein n=1 Tax=Rarobacter faecitabidus TaxID=13243 RepID=A0A542ZUD4_RARFA|nr:hypothetical protein FB461_0432 [Rarobacter faecitabidus]
MYPDEAMPSRVNCATSHFERQGTTMAISTDFILISDQNRAFQTLHDGLAAQGFAITRTPSGGLLARRGSTTATVLLGSHQGVYAR